eukprot:570840-Pelagomonas_calceolata.AAC.11
MAECSPCKLLLPCIANLLPSDNQQQTIHPMLPQPHTRAGVQGLLLIASANARAKSVDLAASWSGPLGGLSKFQKGPPPGLLPSKGIHRKVMMKLMSSGAVTGA